MQQEVSNHRLKEPKGPDPPNLIKGLLTIGFP